MIGASLEFSNTPAKRTIEGQNDVFLNGSTSSIGKYEEKKLNDNSLFFLIRREPLMIFNSLG